MILRCISPVVLFLKPVGLSQVYVAFNILNQHIGRIYLNVCLQPSLLTLRCLYSDLFGYFHRIVLVAYVVVPVHKNISAAKQCLLGNSPSIFTPLFSQFNFLTMHSSVAVNSLDRWCPHVLLLLNPGFSHSLYRCTVTELSVYMSFQVFCA